MVLGRIEGLTMYLKMASTITKKKKKDATVTNKREAANHAPQEGVQEETALGYRP